MEEGVCSIHLRTAWPDQLKVNSNMSTAQKSRGRKQLRSTAHQKIRFLSIRDWTSYYTEQRISFKKQYQETKSEVILTLTDPQMQSYSVMGFRTTVTYQMDLGLPALTFQEEPQREEGTKC